MGLEVGGNCPDWLRSHTHHHASPVLNLKGKEQSGGARARVHGSHVCGACMHGTARAPRTTSAREPPSGGRKPAAATATRRQRRQSRRTHARSPSVCVVAAAHAQATHAWRAHNAPRGAGDRAHEIGRARRMLRRAPRGTAHLLHPAKVTKHARPLLTALPTTTTPGRPRTNEGGGRAICAHRE